jgi:hypothetical protein
MAIIETMATTMGSIVFLFAFIGNLLNDMGVIALPDPFSKACARWNGDVIVEIQ